MQSKKPLRIEKIADVIHKELAIIIAKLCQDPRLENLTITNVKVSKDLSIAKVYFTNFADFNNTLNNNINNSDSDNIKQILEILKNASGFFRAQLAVKSSLRKVPALNFFYDDNTNQGIKIEMLLAKLAHNSEVKNGTN